MLFNIEEICVDSDYRKKDALNVLLLSQVFKNPGISRKEITNRLHLRPSSVSSSCQELIDKGILEEKTVTTSKQRGRPEGALYAVTDHWIAACIFMESLEFRAAFIDITGRILPIDISSFRHSHDDYQRQLDSLIRLVTEKRPEGRKFIGVGLSLPGFNLLPNNTWITTSRHLQQVKTTQIGINTEVSLFWSRSIDARTQALLLSNPQYRKGKTILFHWGYGIAISFAVDGKIINDPFSKFGELGHTIVNVHDAKPCRCGSHGCLETEAAIWAMRPSLSQRFKDVPANEREFSTFLSSRFIEEIPEVENAITYINIGLVNISKLLAPDRILLYGPFTDHDYIYHSILENFYSNRPTSEFKLIEISRIQHSPADEVIGATHELFKQALHQDLKSL